MASVASVSHAPSAMPASFLESHVPARAVRSQAKPAMLANSVVTSIRLVCSAGALWPVLTYRQQADPSQEHTKPLNPSLPSTSSLLDLKKPFVAMTAARLACLVNGKKKKKEKNGKKQIICF